MKKNFNLYTEKKKKCKFEHLVNFYYIKKYKYEYIK